MKPKILLRIAALLLLFHLMGHTFGHLGWRKATQPAKQEVIRQMTDYKFPFMGVVKSMGDYYEGYGWACSIALIFFALVQWFIGNALTESKKLIHQLLVSLCICLFIWGGIEFIFFFPFAAIITFLSGACTLIALLQLQKLKYM